MNEYENNIPLKEEDVLPPFDPPSAVLSVGEWIINWFPGFLFGGIFLLSLLSPNAGSAERFFLLLLATAFVLINLTTTNLWREVRESRQDLKELRQQLSNLQEHSRNE